MSDAQSSGVAKRGRGGGGRASLGVTIPFYDTNWHFMIPFYDTNRTKEQENNSMTSIIGNV